MESEDFQFVSHPNLGTNMCVCIDIYTIFFSYPTPPMPHPPPQPHVPHPPPPRPPPTRGVGRVGWGIEGVGYEKNIVYI